MKKHKKKPCLCERCGSPLADGFCADKTCPFSKHVQTCPIGWVHPACIAGIQTTVEASSDRL